MPRVPKNLLKFSHSIPSLLRARRKELGLTLQQLAKASGLSAAFISQAERGISTPSVISLMQLSSALGVEISYFISSPPADSMIHRADSPRHLNIDSPVTYTRIDSDIRNQKMNGLIMEIPPNYIFPTPVHRDGEDLIYVLQGKVELQIGDESFVLSEGDSAHFHAHLDHVMRNTESAPTKILWTGTPSIFPQTEKPDQTK